MTKLPINPQAVAVYQILIEECGAQPGNDPGSVHSQFLHLWPVSEFRFQGALGFGGKIHGGGYRLPPKVTCYTEDETSERLQMIKRANARLARLPKEER